MALGKLRVPLNINHVSVALGVMNAMLSMHDYMSHTIKEFSTGDLLCFVSLRHSVLSHKLHPRVWPSCQ